MHTKDFLAQELRKVGLEEMAKKAETGYYHDYLSPLAMPEMQLEADLRTARDMVQWTAPQRDAIEAVRKRHLNGEFDANHEESEEWARSPEGQEAFAHLVNSVKGGKS